MVHHNIHTDGFQNVSLLYKATNGSQAAGLITSQRENHDLKLNDKMKKFLNGTFL